MTMEQKAKAYDKAIIKAKELYNQGLINPPLEHIFPELAESEDEKIRKALINFFNRFPYDSIEAAGTNAKEVLAWLEKQGQVKESSILQHKGTHEDASCKENDNSLTREQKPQRFISAEAKEALYGEPTAWSERDERFLNQVMEEVDYALNDKDMFYSGASPIIDWLKDLKQRLGG